GSHGAEERRSSEKSFSDYKEGKNSTEQLEGMDSSEHVATESTANSKSKSLQQDDQGAVQISERETAWDQSERSVASLEAPDSQSARCAGHRFCTERSKEEYAKYPMPCVSSYWQEIEPPIFFVDDGIS